MNKTCPAAFFAKSRFVYRPGLKQHRISLLMKAFPCIFWIFVLTGFGMNAQSPQKPNIIIIIADDAGWSDFGFHGSEIKTPHMDSLALKGVQLNRFYVNPTCSPTRASFLTGRPASRMGIVAPISDKSELSLPDSITTLPRLLKQQGYSTALFGKWHLGLRPESGPEKYGFDYSYGFLHGQIDQYTHHYKNGDRSWHRNGTFIDEQGHATDLIADEAIKWLDSLRNPSENFFVQIAFSAPHFPLQEEEKWKKPYKNTFKNASRIAYAAAMTHMDAAIGNILKELDKKGLDKNTLILFFNDNGAMENWYPKDQYNGKFGPNPELGKNLPLRDWKTSNYEGAIRVPAVVYWKGHTEKGISNSYISVTDMMPTLAALAGCPEIPDTVEGRNVSDCFFDPGASMDNDIYIRGHLQECFIEKPWKLIRTRTANDTPLYELYNIETDPYEKNDLIEKDPEVFARLKTGLTDQFQKDSKEVNLDIAGHR